MDSGSRMDLLVAVYCCLLSVLGSRNGETASIFQCGGRLQSAAESNEGLRCSFAVCIYQEWLLLLCY